MMLITHHFSNPESLREFHPRALIEYEIRRCINPCAEHPCAPSANCRAVNHRAICTCPDGYIGSPTTSCRPREYTPLAVKDRPIRSLEQGGFTGLGPEIELICSLKITYAIILC